MKRRIVLGIVALFLVLAAAGFSTARAREAWSAQAAASTFHKQRARTEAILHSLGSDGVPARDVAPLLARDATLRTMQPPAGLALWPADTVAFYNSQTRAYRALQSRGHAVLNRAAARSRATAEGAMQKLRGTIDAATALYLNTDSATGVLQHTEDALSTDRLPRDYKAAASQVESARTTLAAAVATRQAYVGSVLKRANGQQTNVVATAQTEADAEKAHLDLLGIFSPRAAQDGQDLTTSLAAVKQASSAQAAAAREWSVHDTVSTIERDFAQIVPTKVIVVSTEDQWATMYENGTQVYSTPVTTGGPELPTDHGIFHIFMKASPFTFHSPFPTTSQYWYPPTPVTYWMPFDGQEGLHDASWRSNFGPGSNLQPTDLGTGVYILGTHGCVNLPTPAAAWVWDWAPIGTTVVVR